MIDQEVAASQSQSLGADSNENTSSNSEPSKGHHFLHGMVVVLERLESQLGEEYKDLSAAVGALIEKIRSRIA